MTAFDRIKKLAKEQHLTLAKINEKAGIGTNSIYRWKTQVPTSENLQKVAKVLHTSTDYLLGNTNDPSQVSQKSDEDEDLTWQDFGMAYGGRIPDDLRKLYTAMAEQYVKDHPEALKESFEEEDDDLDDLL
ncbi:MAG: helix-turn-helix transcriptional regulator [Gilliamella sp.]|uniref:helix-turn-helix domain-containing protein n=1 Tax=Lactobacillus sp. ESL0230 TaxID=2069353 RepID=UPI000EFAD95F|nr:helix-turn-helix transcriptional regulator [Lactobacillus sp. ESL0230]MCO6528630.1 helix-turn-helix transcriptional regulator [Lactobacillus sp.]MCO6555447.1 helix-turn-helix transcriptional regulator [Gilliamella sp.]RMC46548.1 XRE family transcriptional regulator [Lactobacillus sp. ESL0230]